jgi:predicted RNA-binding Zn-ribbon protein involved in translation (DUF1610 family)
MAENQTITLRCPTCGDKNRFEAPTVMNAGKSEDIPTLVKLFESAESGFQKENPYTFMCPRCGHTESALWPEIQVYFPYRGFDTELFLAVPKPDETREEAAFRVAGKPTVWSRMTRAVFMGRARRVCFSIEDFIEHGRMLSVHLYDHYAAITVALCLLRMQEETDDRFTYANARFSVSNPEVFGDYGHLKNFYVVFTSETGKRTRVVNFPLDLYLQLVNKSVISAWDEPLIADMSWALPIAEELYPQIRIPEGS